MTHFVSACGIFTFYISFNAFLSSNQIEL